MYHRPMTAREREFSLAIRASMNGKTCMAIALDAIAPYYHNHGQQAERAFAFTVLGILRNADPYGDNDIGSVQVKSRRATLKPETDSKAEFFAYVSNDLRTAWVMTPETWADFVALFSGIEKASERSAHGEYRRRIGSADRKMETWLSARA